MDSQLVLVCIAKWAVAAWQEDLEQASDNE
jgi:hypothetical protein